MDCSFLILMQSLHLLFFCSAVFTIFPIIRRRRLKIRVSWLHNSNYFNIENTKLILDILIFDHYQNSIY